MTESLLHLVLSCHLAVLCDCSSCDYLQVPQFRVDALIQVVCVVGDIHQTVPQDYIVDAIASENSQPGADLRGIDFRVHVKIPWNAPESVVTLDSPGVFVLDTTCVPDVLGLKTRYADAETLRVLPGRACESV